jgi:hypothetical protein
MSLFKAFATDHDKEASGFWFEDTGVVNKDKTTPGFLLARASRANPRFAKATEKLGKKFQRQLANDLLPAEKALELNKAMFLDTILLDWRNVYDEDEQPIQFTRDNADKLITLLPDLYELLEQAANRASNFRDDEIEEDAGN